MIIGRRRVKIVSHSNRQASLYFIMNGDSGSNNMSSIVNLSQTGETNQQLSSTAQLTSMIQQIQG